MRFSRRDVLKTALAAIPGAALSRFGQSARATQRPPTGGLASWQRESSVAAAIKSGNIPPGSPLEAVVRSLTARNTTGLPRFDRNTLERVIPDGFVRSPAVPAAPALRDRFADFHRHFVFEYYPWYETNPWAHWSQKGYNPPHHISSTMMPALGAYDSASRAVVEQHARWIADSGVGAIAISWWGQGSYGDRATHMIMDVMRAHDIHVTFHLEPYRNDRAIYYASDVNYILREYGERRQWDNFLLLQNADGSSAPVFKTFRTILPETIIDCQGIVRNVNDYAPDAVWRQQTDAIRANARPLFDRVVLLADSLNVGRTAAGGFDGIAIYDAFVRPHTWAGAARDFGGSRLLYSFAVNCGFDAAIPVVPDGPCDLPQPFEPPIGQPNFNDPASRMAAEASARARIRESMATTIDLQGDSNLYNASQGFFLTYLTTFNEWHEGTSFEPARNRADLPPEQRGFNYHNPDDGDWRMDELRTLMRQATGS